MVLLEAPKESGVTLAFTPQRDGYGWAMILSQAHARSANKETVNLRLDFLHFTSSAPFPFFQFFLFVSVSFFVSLEFLPCHGHVMAMS